MESRVLNAPVDGQQADIVHFNLVRRAYFVISPTATRDGWLDFFNQTVDGIWLYALPSTNTQNSQPNGWKVAFELKSTKIITLELYDTKETFGTVFLVRTFTDNSDAAAPSDWKVLTTSGPCHAGRRMKAGVTLKDIILKIQAAGLINYQLKEGRGHRFWVAAIISTLGNLIFEPISYIPLSKEADELMRRCWVEVNKHTGKFGFEDEPTNRLNIVEGRWQHTSTGQGI
ncbi:hypothetical protein F4805DRAFT_89889 [Annulohypoxylon moriforme]|nr:hypothetical protein F4805DRAFT_89889 [Annulohypoxylon moriforme]